MDTERRAPDAADPGNRAAEFFDLAKSMMDTYDQAVRDVLATRSSLSEEERLRIYSVIANFQPKLEKLFQNLCRGCGSFVLIRELSERMKPAARDDPGEQMRAVADFVAAVLRERAPLRDKVAMMSLADLSPGYAALDATARGFIDGRVQSLLPSQMDRGDRMLFLASGIFLFHFGGVPEAGVADRKARLLGFVRDVLGLPPSEGPEGRSGSGSGAAAAGVQPGFLTGFDLERRLSERFADTPRQARAGCRTEADQAREDLAAFAREVDFLFEPAWDATANGINAALMVPTRTLPNGTVLTGDAVLDPAMRMHHRYAFQVMKLNAAVSALLGQAAAAGADEATCPVVVVPLSFSDLAQAGLDDFSRDLASILFGYRGSRLAVLVTDADERLPYNHVKGLAVAFRDRGIGLHCRLPFAHEYVPVLARRGESLFAVDLEDVLRLGFETEITSRIVGEFARTSRNREAGAMVLNVPTSIHAQVAHRAGFRLVTGKVVGPRQPILFRTRDLSPSVLLQKM